MLLAYAGHMAVGFRIRVVARRHYAVPVDAGLRPALQQQIHVVIDISFRGGPGLSCAAEAVTIYNHGFSPCLVQAVAPLYLLSNRCMLPPRIISSCDLGNLSTRILKISRRQSTSGSSDPKMIFSGPSSFTASSK